MNRRKFLYAASAGTASATFPAPAISQGMRELKMVTSWPKGLPGLQASAERVAQGITTVTGKRLQVKVFGAGEMVKPFEVFDAVSSGVADLYHTAEYYWEKQAPGFNFFTTVPFGFTADEMAAWVPAQLAARIQSFRSCRISSRLARDRICRGPKHRGRVPLC